MHERLVWILYICGFGVMNFGVEDFCSLHRSLLSFFFFAAFYSSLNERTRFVYPTIGEFLKLYT